MKLKIPDIKTKDDYYAALFGQLRSFEESADPIVECVAEDLEKRTEKGGFHIESLPDRYRLHNVTYRNGLYQVDWSKELLDGGSSHTQEEWVELLSGNEFCMPPAPLYHATITTLYKNQDQEFVDEIKEMFAKDFEDYYMMTGSRIFTMSGSADPGIRRVPILISTGK